MSSMPCDEIRKNKFDPQSIFAEIIWVFFWLVTEEVFGCLSCFVFSHVFPFSLSDKAKVSNCRVIVHCLAGISRSATIAIAYIMKTMGLSSDDAYR